MTRNDFFAQLQAGLTRLPAAEAEVALEYYREYFDDAPPEDEPRILDELGDPMKIAQQIVAESMVRDIVVYTPPKQEKREEKKQPRQGISAVWTVILAIFAAPIALPMAIALVAVAVALVIVAVALAIALFAACAGLIVGGVFAFFVGFAAMTTHVLSGLWSIGMGMAFAGLGLLLALPTIWLVRTMFNGIARSLGRQIFDRKGSAI